MSCDYRCNKMCPRAIYSDSVTVVTVSSVDTLLIDIPTGTYNDGCRYCLFVIQSIPTTATINMPVAISIGGVTTTVYPLVKCDCSQVTACAVRSRQRYCVLVSTSGTGGVFKVLKGLSCAPKNVLASLPVTTATAATAAEATTTLNEFEASPSARNFTKTVTTKTVVKSE